MISEIKLPYGLKNEEIVTIEEVDKGLLCECICPSCRKQLIAKKGDIKTHHFAHYNSLDCFGGLETVLHQICKEIISNAATFTTPALYYPNTKYPIFSEKEIPVDNIQLEKKLGCIVPDIIIESKRKKLAIEIVVTNQVDKNKKRKIESENIATVVIYAKHLLEELYLKKDFRLTDKTFQKEIINGTKYKYWFFNPKLEKIILQLKEQFAKKKSVKLVDGEHAFFYYVEECPLEKHFWQGGRNVGKSYAKVDDDCCKCRFSIISKIHLSPNIYCLGHRQDEFYQLINQLK